MKLLFDENLSFRLVSLLRHEYPGSHHVRDVGLLGAEDGAVWERARLEQLVIVSKDTDFRDRSLVYGSPPKVVWLDVANSGTETVAALLRKHHPVIERFVEEMSSSLLVLSIGRRAI